MTNGIRVDLDTFNRLETSEAKIDAIFKNTAYLIDQNEECQNRITTLEQSKKKNIASATGSGGIGAAIILLGEYFWAKISGG